VLRCSKQLRSSLPRDVAQSVTCAITGSRLDYCNSLYYGMSNNNNFQRLQRVQNAAAQIVCQAPRRQHHSADLPLVTGAWQSRLQDCRTLFVITPSNCNNLRILLVYSRHTDSRAFWGHLHQTYCQQSPH